MLLWKVLRTNSGVLNPIENKLDLVDKWSDITELSYVHGIWVTRKNQLSKSEVDDLIQSARFSTSHLTEIAALQPQSPPQGLVEYLSTFFYELDERNERSLVEFIRMAYYHEIIEDHPDLKFSITPSLQSSNIQIFPTS